MSVAEGADRCAKAFLIFLNVFVIVSDMLVSTLCNLCTINLLSALALAGAFDGGVRYYE